MGGIHDRAVWVVDGDRVVGRLFVDNWERCVPKWAVLPVSAMMEVVGGPVEVSKLVEETG
jgi:hypothetical protein